MSLNLDLWKLLAGLGIFLFGMMLIEESVKSLSGRAFRRIIRMYTNGRFRSIGSGALVTALLQSSSAVSLMVLAFVGAGVMSMQNAIGVIMGSNIGTTLTAWIIATIGFKIKIETLALPFIGLGAVGLILFKPFSKPFLVTRLFNGFGFLFPDLDFMKGSVKSFTQALSRGQAGVPVFQFRPYLRDSGSTPGKDNQQRFSPYPKSAQKKRIKFSGQEKTVDAIISAIGID